MTGRLCVACKVELVEGENWSVGCSKNNTYKCRDCRIEYQRQYYIDHKIEQDRKGKLRYEANRARYCKISNVARIKRQYGITLEEYNIILEDPCNICGKDTDKVLDHNHSTGKIRGALCRQCNAALGLFKDDIELIVQAVRYLNEND